MVDGMNITEVNNTVAETLKYCVTGKQHRTAYPTETDIELLNHMKLYTEMCLVLCMSIFGETAPLLRYGKKVKVI